MNSWTELVDHSESGTIFTEVVMEMVKDYKIITLCRKPISIFAESSAERFLNVCYFTPMVLITKVFFKRELEYIATPTIRQM